MPSMADKLATHLEVIRIFGTPCTRAESFVYIYLSNRDLYRVLSDTHLSRSYAGIVLRFDSFKFVEYTTARGSMAAMGLHTVDAEPHFACAADPQTAHFSFTALQVAQLCMQRSRIVHCTQCS